MPADVPLPGQLGSESAPFVLPTETISTGGGGGGSIFPGIAGIIGGALGGIGSVVSGLFANHSAKRQMEFQERMSSTAHQREVKDLRAAGLNPMLSASHGGASAPQGAGAVMPNPGTDIGQGVAQSGRMLGIELPALESSIRLQAAQSEAAMGQAEAQRASAALSLAETSAVSSDIRVRNATASRIEQLVKPEVGETLAHAALMREQKNVAQASAKQVRAEEERTRAEAANARARHGRIEYESSALGIGLDAVGKAASAAGEFTPAGSIGKAVFGGPSSAKRVISNLNSMKRRP